MNRRSLIRRIGASVLGFAALSFTDTVNATKKTASSQSDAIALVINKQQKEIAQAELAYFRENGVGSWRGGIEQYHWSDILTRSWDAVRPDAPGVIDSTHSFDVFYSIKSEIVASWTVDTRKKKVQLHKDNSVKIETPEK